jgi:hypothetical protein
MPHEIGAPVGELDADDALALAIGPDDVSEGNLRRLEAVWRRHGPTIWEEIKGTPWGAEFFDGVEPDRGGCSPDCSCHSPLGYES